MPRRSRALAVLGVALTVLGLVLTVTHQPHWRQDGLRTASQRTAGVGHVFVIEIENQDYRSTWGSGSAAPYLARTLRGKGVLLSRYFSTAHHSLPNYLAQVSGQAPSRATQGDCPRYTAFHASGTAAPQQAVGRGCVYPRSVRTIGDQMSAAGLTWRAYLQDMATPCQHPRLGALDPWHAATRAEQYATRHNPFVYFRSVTSRPAYCRAHDVSLAHLTSDLRSASTTRNLTFITPDLCHDGHDARCADGGPGGLRAVNAFLKTWVPVITSSPAYRSDGMLVITVDESDTSAAACCGERPGPNVARAGITGPGGGRVGALVLSPYAAKGTTSSTPYNHYSLLATLEDVFGLPRLGYASTARPFGADVLGTARSSTR